MAKPKETVDVPTTKKFQPKVIKRVTMPTIKVGTNDVTYIKFLEAIQTKVKMEKDDKTGTLIEKTIDIAHVAIYGIGEESMQFLTEGQIVIGDVLKKNLEENYPEAAYVGKAFQIEKKDVEGKRYKNYMIDEIEV